MGKYGIVILGNGFDLFHGHKTSYRDFINSVKQDYDTNLWIIYFDNLIQATGWVDIENEFHNILSRYKHFVDSYSKYNWDTPIEIKYHDLFTFLGFTTLPSSSFITEPYGFDGSTNYRQVSKTDYTYFQLYKSTFEFLDPEGFIMYKDITNKIIDDFNIVKSLLHTYVKDIVKINSYYKKGNSIYRELNTYDHLIVLNFNYTETLSFYNSNLTNIFVHGSVNEDIIFGHNEIQDISFSMFDKHVQTQIADPNYKQKFVSTLIEKNFKPGQLFDLIVLGHSFDKNDHGVISWMYTSLFNNRNYFARLKYFYYPTESNADLINRNYNIKTFYEKNIGSFTNETLDFVNKIRVRYGDIPFEVNIKHGDKRIYNGSDELDYFQRTGTFEKIELT